MLFHPFLAKPSISLCLTALSLLLLVLVLLSVPGPIKGLYWFSVRGENGESISAGVLGWCSMLSSLVSRLTLDVQGERNESRADRIPP